MWCYKNNNPKSRRRQALLILLKCLLFRQALSLADIRVVPSSSSSLTLSTRPISRHRRLTMKATKVEKDPSLVETTSTEDEESSFSPADLQVSFSHVQMYVDKIEPIQVYKDLEERLNKFAGLQRENGLNPKLAGNLSEKKELWDSMTKEGVEKESISLKETEFTSQNRDVIKQLIAGFGFRVTASRLSDSEKDATTQSLLLTSEDLRGVQFIVTALDEETSQSEAEKNKVADQFRHFGAENVKAFLKCHGNRQGFGVMGFRTDNVDLVYQRYQKFHPTLIHDYAYYQSEKVKILEVYAYYIGEGENGEPDRGTILRFVEFQAELSHSALLPGLTRIPATFDGTSQPAYCDHWVSNVHSRTGFLRTLEDTLGFSPKVDFNAGVVAAGEAQIESTVTGNDSQSKLSDTQAALRDQSQVYLPINNALSEVGHVHGFLQEIGQGIQHIASRVENLVDFVQRGNDYRKMTGEGFTFLNIPRSYYGVLSVAHLVEEAVISSGCAKAIMVAALEGKAVALDGAVDLDLSEKDIGQRLDNLVDVNHLSEYHEKKPEILKTIMRSRYKNLYSLLKEHLSEDTYLGIVSNQILVDVQGDDLLFQIFTSNVLQREAGQEAPFFEFIQRVCSECKDEDGCPLEIKPGCGGFGIRNFLTLFLSIEVSKAMLDASQALLSGDEAARKYAQKRVDCFTSQLNESNPILTQISDAMTLEGHFKEQMEQALEQGDMESADEFRSKMEEAGLSKADGNRKLMECSSKYEKQMRVLREAGPSPTS